MGNSICCNKVIKSKEDQNLKSSLIVINESINLNNIREEEHKGKETKKNKSPNNNLLGNPSDSAQVILKKKSNSNVTNNNNNLSPLIRTNNINNISNNNSNLNSLNLNLNQEEREISINQKIAKKSSNSNNLSANLSQNLSYKYKSSGEFDDKCIVIPKKNTENNDSFCYMIFSKEILMIQKKFRIFLSKKKLEDLFLTEFKLLSKVNHIILNEISPKKFIRIKVSEKIKEIFGYLKIDIKKDLNQRLFCIENFLNQFEIFKKIKTEINKKIGDHYSYNKKNFYKKNLKNSKLKITLNPIIRFISAELNETYWGEWNLKFQKHGYGLKFVSKETIYIGSFINDEIEGFGVLIYNIKDAKNNILKEEKLIGSSGNIHLNSGEEGLVSNRYYTFRLSNNSRDIDKSIPSNGCKSFISESSLNSFEDDSFINCSIYIGEFSKGMSQGNGELFLPNGEYFKGEFENNKCNGYGEYHFKNNKVFKGYFINNQITEKGNYYYEDFNKSRIREKFMYNVWKN